MSDKRISIVQVLLLLFLCEMSFASDIIATESKSIANQLIAPQPTITVTYPVDPVPDYTGWEKYFSELLTLALSKINSPYHLKPIITKLHSQARAERLLSMNIVNINWMHTSIEKEKTLLPIRIPLFKGLIGWRIFLIHQSKSKTFENIISLAKLQKMNALQGADWPDTTILTNNGFNLQTSRNTENLLRMLQHGRGDYFPRSIVEVWGELNSFPNMGFIVESNLVLQYPTAYYYFVSKKNPQIKTLVERGLNIAISDGSFDQLFMKYFGESITRSNLQNRKIFTLNNSQISKETQLLPKELWYSPTKN